MRSPACRPNANNAMDALTELVSQHPELEHNEHLTLARLALT